MIRHRLETGPFEFEAGGRLEHFRIVYHTSPRRHDKVIWICHALTANSDAEDWWPQLVGPGKLFDTDRYFVVCVNIPGSPYGTDGPATTDPATGRPFYFGFPAVTVRDMVQASILVRKALDIDQIDLIIGSSVGGYQAMEWAIAEPDVIRQAVLMATAPRVSPWFSAQVEAQRMALEADPTFRACESLSGGAAGLRCARAQGLISYRSYEGYGRTQAEEDPDTLFAGRAASYERYQGEKLVRRQFDAYSYWYLCNAIDSHNVGRGRGGVAAALARITAETTVIGIASDGLFPPQEVKAMAFHITGADYREITSDFGHDGFLLENGQLTHILQPILDRICKS